MKIAILSGGIHYNAGGIETYNYSLINLLVRMGHDVTEMPTNISGFKVREEIKEVKISEDFLANNFLREIILNRKSIKKYKDLTRKYDLVINSGGMFSNFSHDKYVFVQHYDIKYYNLRTHSIDTILRESLLSLLSMRKSFGNPLRKSTRVISYTDKKNNKSEIIRNFSETAKISDSKRIGSVYVGRLSGSPKNAIKLAKRYNGSSLTFIGPGSKQKNINKKAKCRAIGALPHKDIASEVKKHRVLLVPSKYEGCSMTVIESASVGVPSIMFDNYDSAKLFNRLGTSLIVKAGDWNEFNSMASKIEKMSDSDYKTLSERVRKAHSKYFTLEKFEADWSNYIKKHYA